MKQEKKYIGINQSIPYKVLDEAIYRYLKNEPLNSLELVNLLKEYMQGKVRVEKATMHINKILTNNIAVIDKLRIILDHENYIKLNENDRTCLFISLISLAFPVNYELLVILAVGFKVQPKINRNYIEHKIASLYGSNRGIINAVKALMQMLVEYKIVNREKVGIYTHSETIEISNRVISELYIFTDIKLSGSKSILLDDIEYRPWYLFYNPKYNSKGTRFLFKEVESRIGQGYLTI